MLRVGLSAVSVEEAKKNLHTEIPSWDFDAIRLAARNTWNEQLSSIKSNLPIRTFARRFTRLCITR